MGLRAVGLSLASKLLGLLSAISSFGLLSAVSSLALRILSALSPLGLGLATPLLVTLYGASQRRAAPPPSTRPSRRTFWNQRINPSGIKMPFG
jgi:hypothetical protein